VQAEQQQKPQAKHVKHIRVHKPVCPDLRSAIVFYRSLVWERQDVLGEHRLSTYYPERKKHACAYKHFVMVSWRGMAQAYRKQLDKLDDPEIAIRVVFGEYADQALAVSSCESGHSINAHNGQYLGLFQMGESERRIYGHGNTAYEQALAANRYFVASGRDWSPWSCKPW